jgi:putative transcriptional regulator
MVKDEQSKVIEETVEGLYRLGLVSKTDYEKFKILCQSSDNLPNTFKFTEELTPEEIKRIRINARLSPIDFAVYLNTTLSTIERWERGSLKPTDVELKLLNLIRIKGLKAII